MAQLTVPKERMSLQALKKILSGTYTCPDCDAKVDGYRLLYPVDEGKFIYVCPECGCIQARESIYDQFGEKE